jgi:thiol-disulfide isomerase/thioredoxin
MLIIFFLLVFVSIIPFKYSNCQTTRILFDSPTPFDLPDLHLTVTQDTLSNTILPENISNSNVKFLKLYTGKIYDTNNEVNILVEDEKETENFFIDKNYDLNFNNDGEPLAFEKNEGSLVLTIFNNSDNKRFIRIKLDRQPEGNRDVYLDSTGDMKNEWVKIFSSGYKLKNFNGKKGTFYFDTPYLVRRGILKTRKNKYLIGLSDFNLNGLYNDVDSDIVIIDFNNDQRLSAFEPSETFSLKDVIKIENNKYEIEDVDPYGNWIELIESPKKPTSLFINDQVDKSRIKNAIDQNLWEIEAVTLDGNNVKLNDYRGKYLLLNFWGEWCTACMREIPLLVEINDNYFKNNIKIISFIKVYNYEKAKKMISEKGIKYAQIILTEELEVNFKIKGFPTNILILPDGTEAIITGEITSEFFDEYVR